MTAGAFAFLAAVLYGCWWLFIAVPVVIFGWFLAKWCWKIAEAPAGRRTRWNKREKQRLVRAVGYFLTVVALVIAAICVWHRYAPKCEGGCWSWSSISTVRDSGVDEYIALDQDWTYIQASTRDRIDWFPEGAFAYDVRTSDGEVTQYPATMNPSFDVESPLPPGFEMRITDSTESGVMRITRTPRQE